MFKRLPEVLKHFKVSEWCRNGSRGAQGVSYLSRRSCGVQTCLNVFGSIRDVSRCV